MRRVQAAGTVGDHRAPGTGMSRLSSTRFDIVVDSLASRRD